tara:strand:- start:355 stop:561 length:207 start_codon:yes stop_codon:yes gene_type:complete
MKTLNYILYGIGGLLIATVSTGLSPKLIELPNFIRCTCDSATFCLTDEDVMKLHMWQSNRKHLRLKEN